MKPGLKGLFSFLFFIGALLFVALSTSCRTPDLLVLSQKKLAPDVIASVDFNPSRLKRVGVMPFMEGESLLWGDDFQGFLPEAVEIDAAERFSTRISTLVDFEVIPPDKITSLLPREMVEVTTRSQVADICRRLRLDAIFRGRLRISTESAGAGSGKVFIPFVFVTFEVELLDARTGEIVWFVNHHLNSFQFLDKTLKINLSKPVAAEKHLMEKIPGYPDVDRTLTILAEFAIAEVAESFSKSCSEASRR